MPIYGVFEKHQPMNLICNHALCDLQIDCSRIDFNKLGARSAVFFFYLAFWTNHQIQCECAVHKSNERQNHCLFYNVQSIV